MGRASRANQITRHAVFRQSCCSVLYGDFAPSQLARGMEYNAFAMNDDACLFVIFFRLCSCGDFLSLLSLVFSSVRACGCAAVL